jgi:hypothetical protein
MKVSRARSIFCTDLGQPAKRATAALAGVGGAGGHLDVPVTAIINEGMELPPVYADAGHVDVFVTAEFRRILPAQLKEEDEEV